MSASALRMHIAGSAHCSSVSDEGHAMQPAKHARRDLLQSYLPSLLLILCHNVNSPSPCQQSILDRPMRVGAAAWMIELFVLIAFATSLSIATWLCDSSLLQKQTQTKRSFSVHCQSQPWAERPDGHRHEMLSGLKMRSYEVTCYHIRAHTKQSTVAAHLQGIRRLRTMYVLVGCA